MKARSFYLKICEIWKKHILDNFDEHVDYETLNMTAIQYDEAWKHLNEILSFFERTGEDSSTAPADCLFALALITFKKGPHYHVEALDEMQRCFMIYSSKLGEYANKTKEVEQTIEMLTNYVKQNDE